MKKSKTPTVSITLFTSKMKILEKMFQEPNPDKRPSGLKLIGIEWDKVSHVHTARIEITDGEMCDLVYLGYWLRYNEDNNTYQIGDKSKTTQGT